ncbi:interactor of HORMAD1 protein 1 [Echinops telfairi]|uniref:Interactor of HORMAD1 protein 1 n=1 Tax=Echinops telfairi TaxID=9371 RepID=A0ABM0J5J5_ECHTE|nr:interactor of HORMAD1 protein 1 [Echinops telfairi]
MDCNVWNIKEMLTIPSGSGAIKSSNWNNNQSDYSILSDSQFLFGSQFCPENSETLSGPLEIGTHSRHPKQSQQNSLDSEPSIFTKYQTKPKLFGGDTKDGSLFPLPLSAGKSKGLLEQFEEKKKREKDKCESETAGSFMSLVKESIHKLQTSVEKSEEHLSSRSQSSLDSLATLAITLQKMAQAQHAHLLEVVQGKRSMEQTLLKMQKTSEGKQSELVEMKSDLKHLEVSVTQQSKDFQQLREQLAQLDAPSLLADLKKWISLPRGRELMVDSSSQTSPLLAQSLSFTRQEKRTSEEPAACSACMYGVWGEGAKSDALREEATLPIAESRKGSRPGQDKEMQTVCKHRALADHGARDLGSQGASRVRSGDLNHCAASIKKSCRDYEVQDVFSCDPCGQSVVAKPKGRVVQRGKKGNTQQLRRAPRGKPLPRKQESSPRKTTCTVNPKYLGPQPPVFRPQRARQVQPLHLWCSRTPTKPACSTRGLGRGPSENPNILSSSSQRDPQMYWFSNLNTPISESPQLKEQGKNLLYDFLLDSSDEGF